MANSLATAIPIPEWAAVVIAAIAGLVIGSFSNVVVYRVPRGLSIVHPPSACPSCATPIRPLDNIPVLSWLVLAGRCRHCGATISARYPLVEAGTAALFVLVALAVGPHWAVVGLCLMSATLVACLAVELDGERPGWRVPTIGTGLGLAGLAGAAIAERHWAHLGGSVAGAVLGAAAAPVLDRWIAALEPGAHRSGSADGAPNHKSERQRSWPLLPAGAVLGWAGPAGAAAGAGVLCLLLLLLPATGATRAVGAPRTLGEAAVRSNGHQRRHGRRAVGGPLASAGPALAASFAAVVAVSVALALGAALS